MGHSSYRYVDDDCMIIGDVRHTAQGHRGTCCGHSFLPHRKEIQADDNHKAGRRPRGYEDGPAFAQSSI